MKKLILFFCVLSTIAVHAQREKAEVYINSYKELAITEMLRSGVPACITLAQGILESQYGESDLVKSSNNHFGIKCKTEWTGPKMYHDDDEKGECFRVYPSAAESYTDHSDFLKSRPHYAFLFTLDPTDFKGWAKGLKKAGYATLPSYPQKLLKVINDYNLQQYSLMALARIKNGTPVTDPAGVHNTTASTPAAISEKISSGETKGITKTEALANDLIASATSLPIKKNISFPQGIFTINHTKVFYGTEGVSLLSLANQYAIPLSKLLEYNDLAEMDILDRDRLLFIEKKQKKGAIEFHTVANGETLHDISQMQGIRLDSLLEYNNFKKGMNPAPGVKVYLRTVVSATAAKASRAK